jgi:hypothetical protein
MEWARKIKKFYFGENGKISWDNLDGYKHLVTIQLNFIACNLLIKPSYINLNLKF